MDGRGAHEGRGYGDPVERAGRPVNEWEPRQPAGDHHADRRDRVSQFGSQEIPVNVYLWETGIQTDESSGEAQVQRGRKNQIARRVLPNLNHQHVTLRITRGNTTEEPTVRLNDARPGRLEFEIVSASDPPFLRIDD